VKRGHTDGFHAEIVRTNFLRARLYSLVLFGVHMALIVIDLFRLLDGTLAVHRGYRLLFYAHLSLVAVLAAFAVFAFSRPIDKEETPSRSHDVGWRLVVVLMLLLSAAVSILDQFIHGQITVYVIGALGISVGVYLPPRFAVTLYVVAHTLFLAALSAVQTDPDSFVAQIINGTLVVALALVISRMLFVQFRRNHEHLQVIEKQRAILARLAREDSLTRLPNRRSVLERVEEEFERSRRYGSVFSVAVADLDHFKRVNDTYTHAVGDEVLKNVARIFRSTLRTPDLVARYGGEEFLFVFPESTLADARRACDKIREAVAAYSWDGQQPGLRVTTSLGVASSREAESATALIAAADRRLYEAKRAGRNCVRSSAAV